jgi:hypothetical protein
MEHLDNDQTKNLILLINSFLSVFQDVPSRTSILEHDVDVGNAVPIRQHPYRVNSKKREVAYLLQNDMAKPSNSSWSSLCILVPKPNSTSRLCTDYRRVNAVTKSDSFPLPHLDDCILTLFN